MALRRVQALQQRGPAVAAEAAQNAPARTAGDHEGGVAHTHQDGKILQLCGEDAAEPVLGAGQSRTWRGGAYVVGLRDGAQPGEARGGSTAGRAGGAGGGQDAQVEPEVAQACGSLRALSLIRDLSFQGNSTTWMPRPCSSKSSNT